MTINVTNKDSVISHLTWVFDVVRLSSITYTDNKSRIEIIRHPASFTTLGSPLRFKSCGPEATIKYLVDDAAES